MIFPDRVSFWYISHSGGFFSAFLNHQYSRVVTKKYGKLFEKDLGCAGLFFSCSKNTLWSFPKKSPPKKRHRAQIDEDGESSKPRNPHRRSLSSFFKVTFSFPQNGGHQQALKRSAVGPNEVTT